MPPFILRRPAASSTTTPSRSSVLLMARKAHAAPVIANKGLPFFQQLELASQIRYHLEDNNEHYRGEKVVPSGHDLLSPARRRSILAAVAAEAERRSPRLAAGAAALTATDFCSSLSLTPSKFDLSLPTPIVDGEGLVMGVGTSNPSLGWTNKAVALSKKLIAGARLGGFNDGPLVFGVVWKFPGDLNNLSPAPTTRFVSGFPVGGINADPALVQAAALGNELVADFFPGVAAIMGVRMDQLIQRARSPPFPGVLPSCEIRLLGQGAAESRVEWVVRDGHVAVYSVFGKWDHKKVGHLMLPADGKMFPLKVGEMFVLPSGTKEFAFVPVREDKGEYQFLFVQYFHSAVYRWVEKGGFTDAQYERSIRRDMLSDHKKAAMKLKTWMEGRRGAGRQRAKKVYRALGDVFV
ncbi:hypothetical protein C8F01DRAFT_1093085 [Mycena amicta]|nr:hypothetical protein C8F01DRAFT_1093085 [Mycena amicta]